MKEFFISCILYIGLNKDKMSGGEEDDQGFLDFLADRASDSYKSYMRVYTKTPLLCYRVLSKVYKRIVQQYHKYSWPAQKQSFSYRASQMLHWGSILLLSVQGFMDAIFHTEVFDLLDNRQISLLLYHFSKLICHSNFCGVFPFMHQVDVHNFFDFSMATTEAVIDTPKLSHYEIRECIEKLQRRMCSGVFGAFQDLVGSSMDTKQINKLRHQFYGNHSLIPVHASFLHAAHTFLMKEVLPRALNSNYSAYLQARRNRQLEPPPPKRLNPSKQRRQAKRRAAASLKKEPKERREESPDLL